MYICSDKNERQRDRLARKDYELAKKVYTYFVEESRGRVSHNEKWLEVINEDV